MNNVFYYQVYGWCWSDSMQEWQWLFLYTKVKKVIVRYSQYIYSLLFYTSGFLSENRGIHWNRYNRIKRK